MAARPLGTSTTGGHFEILAIDGTTWLPLVLVPQKQDSAESANGALTVGSILASAESDARVTPRVKLIRQEDWSGGYGVSHNGAVATYARTPGYVLPAGAATSITLPGGGASNTPLVAIEEFGADLFIAQEGDAVTGGRVLRSVGGGDTFTASLTLAAGEIIRDLLVFGNGAVTPRLYAFSSSVGAASGRLHQWDGAAWTSTAAATFGTNGRNRSAKVFWRTNDGLGGMRINSINAPTTISYTKPDADPMLAASWIEAVNIGTGYSLVEIAAAREHAWYAGKDGIFDLNGLGDSPNLIGHGARQLEASIPFPVMYAQDHVYWSLGQHLERVYVGQEGVLQEVPAICTPGWGTRADAEWGRGYVVALAIDQGQIVCCIYNPTTTRNAIFWGYPAAPTEERANPLVWHGPECVSTTGIRVTRMKTSALTGDLRLWVCAWPVGGAPVLDRISLPIAGSPIQDLVSGGSHRYTPGNGSGRWQRDSYLQLLSEGGGDRVSNKIIHSHGVIARGLDQASGTKLRMLTRVDAEPGATTYTESQDIPTNYTELIPTAVYEGRQIERRIDFVSPNGGALPPRVGVLDAVNLGVWEITPQTRVRTINCMANPGEAMSPDYITAELIRVTRFKRTTIREANNQRWTIKIDQVFADEETIDPRSPYGKRMEYALTVEYLAGPL